MNKKEMIDKIYEVVSDKTLNFGCIIQHSYLGKLMYLGQSNYKHSEYNNFNNYIYAIRINSKGKQRVKVTGEYKIIGHPVMISDVLDWIKKQNTQLFNSNSDMYVFNKCFSINWSDYKKPIEDQSEECITYVYNLITK